MKMESAVSSLNDCKIIVTGGAGYLAWNLVSLFKKVSCSIYRLDRSGADFPPFEGLPVVSDIIGDMTAPGIWEDYIKNTDLIFHFAAQTSIHQSAVEPLLDLHVNVVPILHLINSARRHGKAPFVLFSGTVTETGLTDALPVDESFPDHPVTIYDIHKLTAEKYLEYFSLEGIISATVLRLANVYGPGPRSSSADRGVLNGMIRKALNGEHLTIYGEGEYIRDYIYVEDVAKAFIAAAINKDRVNGKHFVIGSGRGTEFRTAVHLVAQRVEKKTGIKASVLHIDPPKPLLPIDTRNFIANTARFQEATGWKPLVSLAEGIDKTIDSFLDERVSSA